MTEKTDTVLTAILAELQGLRADLNRVEKRNREHRAVTIRHHLQDFADQIANTTHVSGSS